MKKQAQAEEFDPSPRTSGELRLVTALDESGARHESNRWFPSLAVLPAVSGRECARVLESAGYRRCNPPPAVVWLERDGRCIAVPLSRVVDANVLAALLREARITPVEFIERLNEPSSREQ
jgi:hypothetical protein